MKAMIEKIGHVRFRVLAGSAVYLFVLGWFLLCAAPTLYWGDSAEMTGVACSLGVAHSPGYPLFSALARAFLWLPLPLPFAANVMSVFLAAGAAALLFFFLWRSTGHVFAAVAGALLFLGVPAFAAQSLFIEVYALHLALFCGVLYCVAARESGGDARWFLGALLLLGLGMAHHILMSFALASWLVYCILRPGHEERAAAVPVLWLLAFSFMNVLTSHSLAEEHIRTYKYCLIGLGAAYVLYMVLIARFARGQFGLSVRTALAGLFLAASAVSVLVYLPLASARGPAADWWSPDTPGNFLNLLLLKGYPPTFPGSGVELMKRLDLTGMVQQVPLYVMAAAAIGLIVIFVRRARLGVFVLLTAAATFAGALLVKHGKPEALRLPVYMAFAMTACWATAWLLGWKLWRGKWWKVALSLPLYLVIAGAVVAGLMRIDERMTARSGAAYELGSRIIADTADDSLLFIGEQTPGIMGYFTACEPQKLKSKRIAVIPVSFLSFDWKVDQLRDEYPGIYFPPVEERRGTENVFGVTGDDRVKYAISMIRANSEKKNLYSDFYFLPLESGYMTVPHGVVYRLAGRESFAAFQVDSMFDEDKSPKWRSLDRRDDTAAKNIASVHNERGVVYLRYAKMYGNQAMFERAKEEFGRAIKINRGYADAYSNLGICKFMEGDVKEAIKLQRKAVSLDPEKPELYNALAETMLQRHSQKGVEQAIALYKISLALKPKQPQVLYNLGTAFLMMKNKELAVANYKAALAADPEYIEAYRALSRVLQTMDACGESVSWMEMAAERTPRNIDIQAELLKRYYSCGWKNLFEQSMEDLYRSFPHDINFYQAVGTIFRDTGRIDLAIQIYRQAKVRYPNFKLDNLFMSLPTDNCEMSLPPLREVVRQAPGDFSVRFHYAANLCMCGKAAECEAQLLEAKRLSPRERGVDELLRQLNVLKKERPELFKPESPGAATR